MTSALIWILPALSFLAGIAALIAVLVRLKRSRSDAHDVLETSLREEFRAFRIENTHLARELREEISGAQLKTRDSILQSLHAFVSHQKQEFALLREDNNAKLEAIRRTTEERLSAGERVQRQGVADFRTEMSKLTEAMGRDLEKARAALDSKLAQIQAGNEKKLDEMRQTVDEKLQSTLEKRLGESFKQVSERLEAVQRGLGEMQSLATGVGDLKRVLTNVKERGTWGEYQLGAILEEILTPDQYRRNVSPKDNGEMVEFAVKLPGKAAQDAPPVWLPIDAKFPKEDYERLLDAVHRADHEQIKTTSKALGTAILRAAKDIHDKYIEPPATTDFGILFLPTEGLYAEILRQPGLHDEIQRKHRVLVAGPTTLSAILSSLRVGFQTLAIEKRAHEVWTVLGAFKTEFGKFGGVLDKIKKQLHAVSNTLDESSTRTRAMQRKLRSVEALPADEAEAVLALPQDDVAEGDDDLSAAAPEFQDPGTAG